MSIKIPRKLNPDPAKQELEVRLRNVLRQTLKEHADKNIPLVYQNKECIKSSQFVHQYPNGRKFLIDQNRLNSKETILREL